MKFIGTIRDAADKWKFFLIVSETSSFTTSYRM